MSMIEIFYLLGEEFGIWLSADLGLRSSCVPTRVPHPVEHYGKTRPEHVRGYKVVLVVAAHIIACRYPERLVDRKKKEGIEFNGSSEAEAVAVQRIWRKAVRVTGHN